MASLPSYEDGDSVNTMEGNGFHEPNAHDESSNAPHIEPRIGDEFQVEIPPLSGDSTCNEDTVLHIQNFLDGLPVPCFRQELKTPSVRNSLDGEKSRVSFWVPGFRTEQWSDAHKTSFLLGVYIFQKDFVKVTQFVETKQVGDIMSFYYTEFYGSNVYRRWSEGRKPKSKKCVYGDMIFTGWRQQELLSRLRPKTPEHRYDSLVEASKRFSDEKMTLAEYVSHLKAMVGMSILIEAIGVGTGKRDLTGMSLEPSRSNKAAPVRPEIPTGEACALLANTSIINFIKNYRLSKSQSNDLFWEAVWPRLLARGWHSEQPQDQVLRNGLVFLMPDVKKFSRRKHKIGKHYFDSVTDILNKVGKEPGLIELDFVENNGGKNDKVSKVEQELEENDDGSPSMPRVSYLQPRTPNRGSDAISFTIVDTSLPGGKVIELRSLPTEVLSLVSCRSHAEDRHEDTDVTETMKQSGEKTNSCTEMSSDAGNLKNKNGLHKQKHTTKVPKSLSSEKLKRTNGDGVAPMKKKSRKSAASSLDTTADVASQSCAAPRFENEISGCSLSIHNFPEKLSSRTGACQDKTSTTSSSKGSLSESVECATYCSNVRATEPSLETETHSLIDLDVPQMSPELKSAFISMQSSKEQEIRTPETYNHRSPASTSAIGSINEQEPTENNRRHSTRTRPPTTRVLQALEAGLLPENRRRKSKDGSAREELAHRPSRRARHAARPAKSTNSIVSPQTEEAENGGKSNEFCSTQSQPQVNEEDSGSGHDSTLPANNELDLFR